MIHINLDYTRGIMSKRETSCGIHLRGLAPGQHSSEETSQLWQAVGGAVCDLTEPVIELKPPTPIAMCVTTTPTSWRKHFIFVIIMFNFSQEEHQQIIDYFTPPPTPEDGNTNYTISSNNSLVTTTNVDDITSGVGSPSFTTVASLLTSTYSDYTDSNSDDYYYEYSGGGTDAGVEDGCMRYDEPPVAYAHVWVNFIVMFLLPILVSIINE